MPQLAPHHFHHSAAADVSIGCVTAMLSGRIALVTGGAQGIGQAICRVFNREGARVVVADLNVDGCHQTVQEIGQDGRHLALRMDVSDPRSVEEAFKSILEEYREPPALVANSAGIEMSDYLLKMSDKVFDDVISVNLKGTFLVNRQAALHMKEHNIEQGSIINLSSIIGEAGAVKECNYAAAKAGVIGFTKSIAKELAKFGIRANCICPGYIETAMTENLPEHLKQIMTMQIPLRKPGQPEDVAETAAFLASTRSKYITGAVIDVNGGML